jgi:hypothetical protein
MERSEIRGLPVRVARSAPHSVEPVIGPATSGRTRWLPAGYGLARDDCRFLVYMREREGLNARRSLKFCSVKITQDVRDYAATLGANEKAALDPDVAHAG